MQAMSKQWALIGLALSVAMLWAQSDVSLRSRIVSAYTQQMVAGNCGVEFALAIAGNDPQTYVCLGSSAGATFYRYTPGSTPERVGHVVLNAIVDADAAGTTSEAFLALTDSSNGVYLLRLTPGGGGVITPYGLAAVSASRAQIERLSDGSYLVLVGTAAGRVRAYVWAPGSPVSLPSDPLSLGAPAVDLPLFSGSVRALRAWTVAGTLYVAAGGYDGIVYLLRWDGSTLQPIGKAMYHPSAVSEIVVNGSRLVVGCANGQVYVWNYTASSVSHHLTLKEPWSGLESHSLCALPGDQVAVATAFVRVYRLSDGVQMGEYGSVVWSNYLRDFYWSPQFPAYTWHPSFYRDYVAKVLPSVNAGNYFVVTAPSYETGYRYYGHSRTVFLPSSGFSHQVTPGSHPVYALAYVANGVASGRSNGAVQAPWGSRNVGEPVFALEGFSAGATSWLLGSYGAGRLFAWSSGGAFVADVLPAPSAPRIVYGVRVLSVAGNEVTFVTCAGDGTVELCRWTIGSTTPATCLSAQQMTRPLHTLSVNANRTDVAVASWLPAWSAYPNAPNAWRMSISNNMLSAPVALGDVRFVAYHPTDPDLLATSLYFARLLLYRISTNTSSVLNAGLVGRWWTYDAFSSGDPFLLAWHPSGNHVVGAWLFNGYVGVWWTGADTIVHSLDPLDRNGNGQYDDPNWIRGGYDRALSEVYEPLRDRVFALITTPSGELVAAGASGQIVRWNRAGAPVFSTWYLSPLVSLDFSPLTGQAVYPARVLLSDTRHALLWSNFNWDYNAPGWAALALNVPGGSSTIRARVLNPSMAHDVMDTDVTVRFRFDVPSGTYRRIEASEDGEWALSTVDPGSRVQVGNQYERRAYLSLLPRARFFSGSTVGDNYTVSFPDGSATAVATALSPSAARIALSMVGSEIRIYDRSGSSWNFSTPTSTIPISLPANAFLKFLADDVLAVASTDANTILQIDVYQLAGGSWTLRQSLNTGLKRSPSHRSLVYYIDALAVGSVVRVAVACDTGLVFYRMDRSGGVVSLTEVGRSTWATNNYFDIAGHHWVRFSRYNPNWVSVANRVQTVVYDLSGLFSW